jgi:hypothetical protein
MVRGMKPAAKLRVILDDDYLCEKCAAIRVPKNQHIEDRYCDDCFPEWQRRYQKAVDEHRERGLAIQEPDRRLRLCEACTRSRPYNHCAECKAEWNPHYQKELDRENAKRRWQYAERKLHREQWTPPTICGSCGKKFKGKRTDAKFCCDLCRLHAHRGVTATSLSKGVNQRAVSSRMTRTVSQ